MYHIKLVSLLVIAFFVLFSTGASIYPQSLQTQKGSVSDVSISALSSNKQTGNEDDWDSYLEFDGTSTAYQGVFTFDASSIALASVGDYYLDVNFKGPKGSNIKWTFEFLDAASTSWVLAGDNSAADSWKWTFFTFCGTTPFASLVSGGNIQVRLTALKSGDNCDIDYLAITTLEGNSSTTVASTAAPTVAPTKAPTRVPSTAATTRPTAAPTSAPATAAPTKAATAAPTKAPTAAPTKAPTSAPTSAPTKAPTAAPTKAPTAAPTKAPTAAATKAPAAPGGRICPAGQVWAPSAGTTWQWQLTGAIDVSKPVQMYDIDLFDATPAIISTLHTKGIAVICYFSTQYENWRADASSFQAADLGSNLDDWPGERYVNIRSSSIRAIMQARLDMAVSKGCDGVEPDNVDEYQNKNGISPKLTAADQADFNQFVASEAHKRGLSVGLKNDLDQAESLQPYYDWALNEQCNQYGECSPLTAFTKAGKAVFGVEYEMKVAQFCPAMQKDNFSWLQKTLDLGSEFTPCCPTGGCKPAAARCYTPTMAKRDVIEEEAAIVDQVVAEAAEPLDYSSAATSTIPAVAVVLAFAIALVL